MAATVKSVPYFYTRIEASPGQAYRLLAQLAQEDINLLAFSAVPFGPNFIELTIFPELESNLMQAARSLNWELSEAQHAFLVQGDDKLGALAGVHEKLFAADVDIYASTGVTDGQGHYGYVIYVKNQDVEKAAKALEADLS